MHPLMSDQEPQKVSPWRNAKNLTALFWAAVVAITALLLLPDNWVFWLVILVVGIVRIAILLAPKTQYKCNKCGNVFQWVGRRATLMPTAADLQAANEGPSCPKCGSKSVVKENKRG
jgi:DNA-directed RNA polymerase subunit RPC12/RpoP